MTETRRFDAAGALEFTLRLPDGGRRVRLYKTLPARRANSVRFVVDDDHRIVYDGPDEAAAREHYVAAAARHGVAVVP